MGLAGAGERSQRKPLFPNLVRKHVFDLGCGYGWQCKFAAEQGVMCVLGIDRSTKMIAEAQRRNADVRIEYRVCGIEKYEYRAEKWDCVISNLASHASLISMQFIKSASDTETRGIFLFTSSIRPLRRAFVRNGFMRRAERRYAGR